METCPISPCGTVNTNGFNKGLNSTCPQHTLLKPGDEILTQITQV